MQVVAQKPQPACNAPGSIFQLRIGLRHRVRAVKKEDCDLLIDLLARVDRTMRPIGWLLPMRLSGGDFKPFDFASIPVFHIHYVAT